MSEAGSPAVMFPFHLGPGIRSFTTPLLFSGELVVTLPGFLSEQPQRTLFETLFDRAKARNHPLLPLLRGVIHHVCLAQKQASHEIKALRPLDHHIKRIVALHPGTRAQYEFWEPLHKDCLALAASALTNVQVLNAACVEFMWRVHEYALELDGDMDAVLVEFSKHVERLGNVDLLLAECLLNRHLLAAYNCGQIATSMPEAIAILARMAPHLSARLGRQTQREDASASRLVAFLLFNELLAAHAPSLQGENVGAVAAWLDNRQDELARLRRRCQEEAVRLVQCFPDERSGRAAFTDAASEMKEEVAALLEIDRHKTRDLIRAVTESDSAWCAIAGAAGLAFGSELGAASLAVAALAVLGASAVRVKHETQSKIESSALSFVYYMRNR